MQSEEELDILYATLNPNTDNFSANKNRFNVVGGGFLQQLRQSLIEHYKSDTLSGNTEYKAIVLKVLGPEEFGGIPVWLEAANQTLQNKNGIIRIVASIPHIHAAIPWPDSEDDENTLSMYPIFEGPLNLGIPVPGQIIRVTYQNIYNQTGPLYLGMATGEGGVAGAQFIQSNQQGLNNSSNASLNNNAQFPERNISRSPFTIRQIVIHESVTKTAEGALRVLLDKGLSVHYVIDKNGTITQHVDLNKAAIHGDGNGTNHNSQSIGIEIVNAFYGSRANENDKVIDVIWAHRGKYIVPPMAQLEAAWNLIKKLCSGPPSGVDSKNYELKLQFPATIYEGKRVGFYWGRWKNHNDAIGIMAHHRWDHSDGLFIEHYCLCRSRGMIPVNAHSTTILKAIEASKQSRITYL